MLRQNAEPPTWIRELPARPLASSSAHPTSRRLLRCPPRSRVEVRHNVYGAPVGSVAPDARSRNANSRGLCVQECIERILSRERWLGYREARKLCQVRAAPIARAIAGTL